MITFKKISEIFNAVMDNKITTNNIGVLENLLKKCLEINLTLWMLEDVARMKENGAKGVANAKSLIDKKNQVRNEIIEKMDIRFAKELNNNTSNPITFFVSESPGMLVDRLSILFIKLKILKNLIELIQDEKLKSEYLIKEKTVSLQIADLSKYMDIYFLRISSGKSFFNIFRSVKIYNDKRIRKYLTRLIVAK